MAVFDLAVQLPEVRAAGATREWVGRQLAVSLAARPRRVAMVDVGFISYVGAFEVVDLGGITDLDVARASGRHLDKQIDPTRTRRHRAACDRPVSRLRDG